MLFKCLAVTCLITGVCLITYTGLNFTTKSNANTLQVSKSKAKDIKKVEWMPAVGVVLLISGIVLMFREKKKSVL